MAIFAKIATMHTIPLNTPICLKAHTGKNLQNEFLWASGRCNTKNTGAREQLILLKTDDNKIVIQSRWNNKHLQVQDSRRCVFANHNQELWEKFDVESDEDGKVYFISCRTGRYMQCDKNGFVVCVHKKRAGWEAWTIVDAKTIFEPEKAKSFFSTPTVVLACAAAGVAVVPALGLTAGVLVPAAMSTFGTVVSGSGTMHASLAPGGVAATLQASSAAFASTTAVTVGGVVGAAIGAVFRRQHRKPKQHG
jgi:hypothetical protein